MPHKGIDHSISFFKGGNEIIMKSSVRFIVSILAVLGLLSGCAEKDQLEDGVS